MTGTVDAAARGAIEAGERGGDQPQADSAGAQGVEGGRYSGRGMGPYGFSRGEGGGGGGHARLRGERQLHITLPSYIQKPFARNWY